MRVFQLTPVFGSAGGTETYVAWLSESLLNRGHQTAVAAAHLSVKGRMSYEVTHAPELAWREAPNPASGRRRILEVVRAFRPDSVVVHGLGDGRLLHMLQSEYSTVEFVHSFLCQGQKLFRRADHTCKHPVGRRCLLDWYVGPCGSARSPVAAVESLRQARDYLRALAQIDRVVVGSRFMKKYLVDEGLDAAHVEVVEMSIGLSAVDLVARRVVREPHVIYVGRTVYAKGVQYLVRAMTLLDPEYHLTVVGGGFYLDALKDLSKRLGVEQRVRFLGELQGSPLRRVCENATVAVVPSIYPEPSGLVVVEMRNLGIPVVVTDVGGLPEWATLYASIHVAESANPASLAAAIRNAVHGVGGSSPNVGEPAQHLVTLLEAIHAERPGEIELALG